MNEEYKAEARRRANIMLAWADGKEVESRPRDCETWGLAPVPAWDWFGVDYRVKPEPRSIHLIEAHGVLSHEAYMVAPPCDARDIAAGYRVVEFVEVLK